MLTIVRYPKPIPVGTSIPVWAYQDVINSDIFNVTRAMAVADLHLPESSASPGPTGTETAVITYTTSPSSIPQVSPSQEHPKHTGAIVGGVIAGVAGLVIVVAAILWRYRRRARRVVKPKEITPASTYHSSDQGHWDDKQQQALLASPPVEQQGLNPPQVIPVTSVFGGKFYVSTRSIYRICSGILLFFKLEGP